MGRKEEKAETALARMKAAEAELEEVTDEEGLSLGEHLSKLRVAIEQHKEAAEGTDALWNAEQLRDRYLAERKAAKAERKKDPSYAENLREAAAARVAAAAAAEKAAVEEAERAAAHEAQLVAEAEARAQAAQQAAQGAVVGHASELEQLEWALAESLRYAPFQELSDPESALAAPASSPGTRAAPPGLAGATPTSPVLSPSVAPGLGLLGTPQAGASTPPKGLKSGSSDWRQPGSGEQPWSGERRSGERRSGERRSGERRSGERRSGGERYSGERYSGERPADDASALEPVAEGEEGDGRSARRARGKPSSSRRQQQGHRTPTNGSHAEGSPSNFAQPRHRKELDMDWRRGA